MEKIVITTGGTGGHIFPALAVAGEILKRHPRCEVLFLGGPGPEGELARKAGLEFRELPAKGIVGRGLKGLFASTWLVGGLCKALAALRSFRPQAVIGFGGYAGFCPVLAARILGIPTAVHEQNSVPGVTNRILGKVARRIFLSFPDRAGAFPAAKTRLTGNPVRPEIAAVGAAAPRAQGRNLLVLGGSQGARAVNDAVIAALPLLREARVEIVHQAGPADAERVRRAYEEAGLDGSAVRGFIEDMAGEYARADLLLCRSGATTVFEAAAAGKPAVLVPFPHATHDHQTVNARALAEAGGAVVLAQSGLTARVLADTVTELLDDSSRLAGMARAARSFARPDAASAIVDGIGELPLRAA
ncbi:MAG: undecaprenyldiphospho-muramoylpentapeptide beta-N-acetylglucosaminyltransferase [Desulfovibrionaceae bacterium]|nr:undecaprenyldiphospho-muramoylpentapeptide beta-N-acetylglucosaminyltransferase [Desulfovibrionaceae bacterium]